MLLLAPGSNQHNRAALVSHADAGTDSLILGVILVSTACWNGRSDDEEVEAPSIARWAILGSSHLRLCFQAMRHQ